MALDLFAPKVNYTLAEENFSRDLIALNTVHCTLFTLKEIQRDR